MPENPSSSNPEPAGTLRAETRLDRWAQAPLALLRDSHMAPRRWPRVPLGRRAAWTWRHRLAATGKPVTDNERKLADCRDRHRGQRCFILGNGPSLNRCDLTRLAGEVTFGVNSIFLGRDRMGFDPTYYVVEDPLVLEDRADEINAYRGPHQRFFGHYASRFVDAGPDVTWLNLRLRYDAYPGFPFFSTNATRQVWAGGTVSYVCLQLAYHMGFDEVHLVGFDHRYQIPDSVRQEGNRLTSTADDPNHFHPGYFGKGLRWHHPRVDRMELAYRRAREAFEADGRRVYNATVGGALEVFERRDYASLFSAAA